jgi:TrmH RNA methyltransferase
MNDSFSGKSGKVKVMYVRSDDSDDSRNKNSRSSGNKGRSSGKPYQGRSEDNRRGGEGRGERRGSGENRGYSRGTESRRPARDFKEDNDAPYSSSPWKVVSRAPSDEPVTPDHGGISGKSFIDPEQLRRQRQEETRVYGENACLALFASRPEAIVRAWFVQSVTPRFREALRWMAANRKAYHVVDDDEISNASGTEHHGGVCFLIKKRQGSDVQSYLQKAPAKDCVLAMANIGNPHNLGGIVRTGAHFAVNGVLIEDPAQLESGAAVRTAEGGAEYVKPIQVDALIQGLDEFRQAGYTVVALSTRQGDAFGKTALPEKVVLLVGEDSELLIEQLCEPQDIRLSLPGQGPVGLNIAVATGILLAEWSRQHA